MSIRIELERLLVPEDMGEAKCAICHKPFEQGVMWAQLLCDCRMDMGVVCPECVEFWGELETPEGQERRFPTIEEYRRLEAAQDGPLAEKLMFEYGMRVAALPSPDREIGFE